MTMYCSFCAKSQHVVRKLVAGPNVHICNECVELCGDICQAEATCGHRPFVDGHRERALKLAHDLNAPILDVIERADAYLAFLRGDAPASSVPEQVAA